MSEIFSQEPETAVLSILVKNPEMYYQIGQLKHGMFSSKPYEIVFRSIDELVTKDIVPSVPVLRNYLEGTGNLRLAGGDELLNYLNSQNYQEDSFKYFCSAIVDSYKARMILNMASRIPDAVSKTDDVSQITNDIQKMLDHLSGTEGAEDTTSISDSITGTFNEIQKRVELGGKIPGVTTGFQGIDLSTGGYCAGDVWTVAGRSSMGKTAWECNSILGAIKSGVPTLCFSLEMPKNSLIERLLAIECGIEITKIRFGSLNQRELDTVFEMSKKFRSLPLYIDSNYGANINYIISVIRKFHKKYGIKVVFLDYIQLLAERNLESTHELGRIMRSLKLIANELGITIVILSQLNRAVESRDDKRPTLADLRQSGNIEEDSDVVLMLYRDEYYNKESKQSGVLENLIRKQRNGPVGTVFSKFVAETNKIYE